jgi:hypothetical protein
MSQPTSGSKNSNKPDDRLSAGPVRWQASYQEELASIDPTLDSCCRRDAEDAIKSKAKTELLKQHDPVANHQRSRRQQKFLQSSNNSSNNNPYVSASASNRNLVTVLMSYGGGSGSSSSFQGCRCCYDPTSDGGEDYPALAALRLQHLQEKAKAEEEEEDANGNRHDKDDECPDSEDDDDELDAFMEGFDEHDGSPEPENVEAEAVASVGWTVSKTWEQRRRLELQRQLEDRQAELYHGYGAHRPLHPSRVFKVAGMYLNSLEQKSSSSTRRRIPPSRCVVHLIDPHSMASASLDLFFERDLAPKMRGTLFVRSDGRSALRLHLEQLMKLLNSPDSVDSGRSLAELLERFRNNNSRTALPALLALRNGHVVNAMAGYDQVWGDPHAGGTIVKEEVVRWLDRSGVLGEDPPRSFELCQLRPEEVALLDSFGLHGAGARTRRGDDDAFFYECGLEGCRKAYPHQHVGVEGGGASHSGFEAAPKVKSSNQH